MTAQEIINYMESLQNEKQRQILMGFFKTGPGEYGDGDEFLGLKVPQTREVVKSVGQGFPLTEIPELLMNRWHEVRLCGFLILVSKFEKQATKRLQHNADAITKRDEIVQLYLQYAEQANNWDLVDLSVHKILGHWLLLPSNLGDRDYKIKVLDELAASPCLWKQRMSIVCSWKTSQMGDPSWCLRYAEIHLHHPHDLMHKAVGWMLRELGKRVSMNLLRDFLYQHAHEMPRTMLRYAIEKMSETERKEWMSIDGGQKKGNVSCSRAKMNPFAGIATPDFVDIILREGDKSDEAMYYLLHQRLTHQLRERYEVCQQQLNDAFEDVLEDFFLYLREGENGMNRLPYQSLRRIKKKDSFETWLLSTFRNYLNNRATAEEKLFHSSNPSNIPDEAKETMLSDEQILTSASQLIAYAHQVFYPRGRFIFLRSLLTMLNKQKALPNEKVAQALGMTDISYRVTVHRMRCNLSRFRQRLLLGEKLRLDEEHQLIAHQIYDEFCHLYPILLTYYTQTIDTLKCADAIKRLRQEYYEATGLLAHEPEASCAVVVSISFFWERLNRMLIV